MFTRPGKIIGGLALLALLPACGGGGDDDGDDPTPGSLAFSAAAYSIDESGGTVTITVTRSGGSDGAAGVEYATADGTATAGEDYTAATGSLAWADGDGAAKTFTVTVADDATVEGDETVTVTLSGATGATLGTPDSATLTIGSEDVAVTVSGVAATGAPLADAAVTLKDRNGASVSTETDDAGEYSLDVSGLTAPFLVQVDDGASIVLYSTAAADGTLNIHPFTNLIVTAYYEVQGLDVNDAFDTLDESTPVPSDLEVRITADVVTRVLTPFLESAGLDPADFDLFTSPFAADGSGFDGLLDETTFANATDFSIDTDGDGTPEQETDVTADAADSVVRFDSTTTDADGNSSQSSEQAQVVSPDAQSDLAAGLAGVEALLTELLATGSDKGADAVAADFELFYDPGFLDNGRGINNEIDTFAQFFSSELETGSVVTLEEIDRVVAFVEDGDADRISVFFKIRIAPPGGESFVQVIRDVSSDERRGAQFRRQAGGDYRFYGNQRLFRVDARTSHQRRYQADQAGSVDLRVLEVRSRSETPGSIDSAVADSADNLLPADCNTDPGNGVARALTAASIAMTLNINNTDEDQYELACSVSGVTAYPPAGTVYTVETTPAAGAPVTYDGITSAVTDEPVSILAINGETPEAFTTTHATGGSVAGTTLTFEVTRPDTFPIVDLSIAGFIQNASQACGSCGGGEDVEGGALDARSDTASIDIPETVDGDAVVSVGVTVRYEGENGEISEAFIQFPPP